MDAGVVRRAEDGREHEVVHLVALRMRMRVRAGAPCVHGDRELAEDHRLAERRRVVVVLRHPPARKVLPRHKVGLGRPVLQVHVVAEHVDGVDGAAAQEVDALVHEPPPVVVGLRVAPRRLGAAEPAVGVVDGRRRLPKVEAVAAMRHQLTGREALHHRRDRRDPHVQRQLARRARRRQLGRAAAARGAQLPHGDRGVVLVPEPRQVVLAVEQLPRALEVERDAPGLGVEARALVAGRLPRVRVAAAAVVVGGGGAARVEALLLQRAQPAAAHVVPVAEQRQHQPQPALARLVDDKVERARHVVVVGGGAGARVRHDPPRVLGERPRAHDRQPELLAVVEDPAHVVEPPRGRLGEQPVHVGADVPPRGVAVDGERAAAHLHKRRQLGRRRRRRGWQRGFRRRPRPDTADEPLLLLGLVGAGGCQQEAEGQAECGSASSGPTHPQPRRAGTLAMKGLQHTVERKRE